MPVSPWMSTVVSVGAIFSSTVKRRRISLLAPITSPNRCRGDKSMVDFWPPATSFTCVAPNRIVAPGATSASSTRTPST